MTAGLAAILIAATPIFTAVLAHLVGQTRLTAARGTGVVLGFVGVAVLIGPDALAGFGAAHVLEELGILAGAFSYAVAGIYSRRFQGVPAIEMACGQLSGAALLLLPLVLFGDGMLGLPMPDAATWWNLFLLVVPCTAGPFILFFYLLARLGAANTLLVTFLSPATTLLLGFGLLGEAVTARAVAGMAVIVLGLVCIDGRVFRMRVAARGVG